MIKIIDKTESFWESLCKDVITFVALALCVWVSRGSIVWEIVAALMFVGALVAWVTAEAKRCTQVFKSEKELGKWVQENIISKEEADKGVAMSQRLIIKECDQIKEMLLQKNADYGDSALNPLRLFSKAPADEQIRVRIDDKLTRLRNQGEKAIAEDTGVDLIGYLILLRVAQKRSRKNREES